MSGQLVDGDRERHPPVVAVGVGGAGDVGAALLADGVLDVVPQQGSVITLGARLTDYDPISSNDSVGSVTIEAPFESGWRRTVTLQLTGDDARIQVTLRLEPI